MIWPKNSFFFFFFRFFFLTVISQSACLSFQGLCHWNMYICMTAHGWPQIASDHTTSQEEIMTSQKNHSLLEKKTMNYDFRLHTLFHKDFSMVLFEDKIIEKPYGVFIYTSYGCSTSCCLWNIMRFSLCETWRQREFALKKFHSHEIFAEENIGINVWFVCHYSLPKACYWKIQNLLSTLRYTLAISFQVWFSLVW